MQLKSNHLMPTQLMPIAEATRGAPECSGSRASSDGAAPFEQTSDGAAPFQPAHSQRMFFKQSNFFKVNFSRSSDLVWQQDFSLQSIRSRIGHDLFLDWQLFKCVQEARHSSNRWCPQICSKITFSATQEVAKIHVSKHTESCLEMWECGGAVDRDRSSGGFVMSIVCCRDLGHKQQGTATTTITTTQEGDRRRWFGGTTRCGEFGCQRRSCLVHFCGCCCCCCRGGRDRDSDWR